MDHQIEHDIDIGSAFTKRRQAMTLEKPRRTQAGLCGQDGGVKTLQVPHLQHPAMGSGQIDEAAGLLHRLGHRLLDQHVRAMA